MSDIPCNETRLLVSRFFFRYFVDAGTHPHPMPGGHYPSKQCHLVATGGVCDAQPDGFKHLFMEKVFKTLSFQVCIHLKVDGFYGARYLTSLLLGLLEPADHVESLKVM